MRGPQRHPWGGKAVQDSTPSGGCSSPGLVLSSRLGSVLDTGEKGGGNQTVYPAARTGGRGAGAGKCMLLLENTSGWKAVSVWGRGRGCRKAAGIRSGKGGWSPGRRAGPLPPPSPVSHTLEFCFPPRGSHTGCPPPPT